MAADVTEYWINGSTGIIRPDAGLTREAAIEAIPNDQEILAPADDSVSTTFELVELPTVVMDRGGFTGVTPNALVTPRRSLYLVWIAYELTVDPSGAKGFVGTLLFGISAAYVGSQHHEDEIPGGVTSGSPGDGTYETPKGPMVIAALDAGTTITWRLANRLFLASGSSPHPSTGAPARFNRAHLHIREMAPA